MPVSIIDQNDNIFQLIKENIPISDIVRAFLPGTEIPKNRKISCPFHEERHPSFHVYVDSFYCFSCGEKGDGVAFVAKLLGLRPIDAARAIASQFNLPVHSGPLSREERAKIAEACIGRERKKQVEEAFSNWCKEATFRLRYLAEGIRAVMQERGLNIEDNLLSLVHFLPLLEYAADVLSLGSENEKLEVYRSPDVRRWL